MAIRYGLYKNTNATTTAAYGKWYSRVVSNGTLSFDDFCEHIADHGNVYSTHDVRCVLGLAIDCIREQVLNGYRVKFGDLGTFYSSISCSGADSASTFSVKGNVQSIKVKLLMNTDYGDITDEAELSSSVTAAEAEAVISSRTSSTDVDDE